MTRRALVLVNPGERGTDRYLDGVSKDVDNYKRFLKLPVGGLWQEHEIVVHHQPSRAITMMEVGRQQMADYSLTIFSGHGYHVADKNSTIVELRSGVDLDSVELRRGAPKHTLILDCCRQVHDTMFVEDSVGKIMKEAGNVINRDDCRKYYDRKIAECANGLVVLFACSIDQTANDISALGGQYSYNLIRMSELWSRETFVNTEDEYKCLSVLAAHERATQIVRKLSAGRQVPTVEKPRSGPYFPFCIIA